jgi:hypothetical protein
MATKIEDLERRLAVVEEWMRTGSPRARDWRLAAGTIADTEFSRRIDAESEAIRLAEFESQVDLSATPSAPRRAP